MPFATGLVLEKGKISEEGGHQELLLKKGLYYSMWRHQAGGEEIIVSGIKI